MNQPKLLLGTSLALLSLSLSPVITEPAAAGTIVNRTVVASQLDNPRGMAFDASGALYVTEAGRGGNSLTIPGPVPNLEMAFGTSGAITRVRNGIQERVIVGLPSLAFNPVGNPLPPSGSNGPTIGAHDLTFDQDGNLLLLFGYSSSKSLSCLK